METVSITLNEERNVSLTAYLQPVGGEFWGIEKRPAMIVLPGGGYMYCSAREADPIAFVYLQAGYQVFILRYSLNEDCKWSNPLDDYEQAYKLISDNSEEWHVDMDKIAVIGFSAGGHLAAATATMSKFRPKACILGYPVIVKETADVYIPSAPDIIAAVDEKTSPCFIFSSRTDGTVPPENTIQLLDALYRNNVPFEAHIYGFANHGFSTCEPCLQNTDWICSRTRNWVKDSLEWLGDTIGVLRVGDPDWMKNTD